MPGCASGGAREQGLNVCFQSLQQCGAGLNLGPREALEAEALVWHQGKADQTEGKEAYIQRFL